MNKRELERALKNIEIAGAALFQLSFEDGLYFYLPPEDINKIKIARNTIRAVHKKLKNSGKVKYLLRRG